MRGRYDRQISDERIGVEMIKQCKKYQKVQKVGLAMCQSRAINFLLFLLHFLHHLFFLCLDISNNGGTVNLSLRFLPQLFHVL